LPNKDLVAVTPHICLDLIFIVPLDSDFVEQKPRVDELLVKTLRGLVFLLLSGIVGEAGIEVKLDLYIILLSLLCKELDLTFILATFDVLVSCEEDCIETNPGLRSRGLGELAPRVKVAGDVASGVFAPPAAF
jgi:hypothetical protein